MSSAPERLPEAAANAYGPIPASTPYAPTFDILGTFASLSCSALRSATRSSASTETDSKLAADATGVTHYYSFPAEPEAADSTLATALANATPPGSIARIGKVIDGSLLAPVAIETCAHLHMGKFALSHNSQDISNKWNYLFQLDYHILINVFFSIGIYFVRYFKRGVYRTMISLTSTSLSFV